MTAEQLVLFGSIDRLIFGDAISIFHELEGKFKGKNYKYQYKPISKHLGSRYIDSINSYDIQLYRQKREFEKQNGQKMRLSTINREHSVITRMFNAFYEWKKLKNVGPYNFSQLQLPETNPGEEVKRADERVYVRTTALTPMEFSTFLEYAHPKVRRICVLAVLTMLRRKDIEFLNLSNFNSALNQLQGQQSKTKLPYNIPVCETVSLIINDTQTEYIVDFTNFRRYFERARKESGIYFQFRDLRRTGATQLLLSGTDLITIQKLLGHGDIKTTQRYLQPNGTHMIEAVNKLEEKFFHKFLNIEKKMLT